MVSDQPSLLDLPTDPLERLMRCGHPAKSLVIREPFAIYCRDCEADYERRAARTSGGAQESAVA